MSYGRVVVCSIFAPFCSARSPVVSVLVVDRLEIVEIQQDERESVSRRGARAELARDLELQRARVRESREAVLERLFLRLFEHQRVVHHRGGVLRDLVDRAGDPRCATPVPRERLRSSR